MADITLKDYDGISRTYKDIDQVVLETTDGEEKIFSLGDVATKEVSLYMADGDQTITPDDGYLLSQVVVIKPENLKEDYIAEGIEIAGITGKFKGGEGVTKTVNLDLVNGDQTVEADENTLMQQVIIRKPTDLIPENIISGASIAGVEGAYEAPKLNAPTAITALTANSSGLQYTTITNPTTNGNFAEKVQLLAEFTDSDDLYAVAEKTVSKTSSTVSLYASDFTYDGGILLNNLRARFTGTGFSPSDDYSVSSFYSLMYINYDLEGGTISPKYKYAFLNDSLSMTLTASSGYYLPKSISLLKLDGTDSGNAYVYDYDTGAVTITIDTSNNDSQILLAMDAVQTPWLRDPIVETEDSIMSVEFLDSNAEITPVSYNDEVIFNIADDREGMIDYDVTTRSDGATYGFTLGTDGYYIDSTAGGSSRVAISRIVFDMKTESTVTLNCINMGYSSTTYGIISNVDCTLSKSYTTDIDTTSSNVYKTFKGSNSSYTTYSITMTIPAGKHFVCIKFIRSTSSTSYYFKYKVNTQPAEYTQYDLLNYLPYGNYSSLGIQSIADGYTSSDIVSVEATLTPKIAISDGLLSFVNTVPSDVNAFDIYFDDVCKGTFSYVHGEENTINLANFVSDVAKTYNIHVCAVGIDETYGKSNVVNAWAGTADTASVYGVSGLYSSATTLTRTDDAVAMTYTINDDGTIDSDFNNVFPWTDTKLVADDYGNEFVMFPTMYFRVGADSSKRITDIAVSALPHDDGTWYKVDPFCYGRYGAYLNGTLLESKTGKTCTASTTRTKFRTYAANNGDGYHQLDLYHYTVLMFLWWIEWATKNGQSIMTGCISGVGTTGGTSYMATGGTDGVATPSGYELTRHQMRYHYIEDFVGNYSEFIDGVYMRVGTSNYDYATADPSKFSDTTTNLNKLSYPATASGSYNIAAFGWDSDNPFLCTPCAKVTNTSYNTYFCGEIYRYSGYINLRVGACAPYANAGDGTTFYYGSGTSTAATYIGSRLMYNGQLTPIPANIEQTLNGTELTVNGFYTITQNDDSLEVT